MLQHKVLLLQELVQQRTLWVIDGDTIMLSENLDPVNDLNFFLSVTFYVSQLPSQGRTIKAGEKAQLTFEASRLNIQNGNYWTFFYRVNHQLMRINNGQVRIWRPQRGKKFGEDGVQGVQGVQGQIGSAQQLAFDAEKGVGTAIQYVNWDGVQYTFLGTTRKFF
jgi:hypothetical protein